MSTDIGTVYTAIHTLGCWSTLQEVAQEIGMADKPARQTLELVQVLTGRRLVERREDPETGIVRYRTAGGDDGE